MKLKLRPDRIDPDWLRDPERLRRVRADQIVKHYGPGPHPSGSPQSVHADGSERKHGNLTMRVIRGEQDHGGEIEVFSGSEKVGGMKWSLNGVSWIGVQPKFRRQGVATAMYRWARELSPELNHGMVLSEDAQKWVASLEPDEQEQIRKFLAKHYGPGPHPGTGTDQSVHSSQVRAGIDDDPLLTRLAADLHARAASLESEVTPMMRTIADRFGGELAGFDHRIKSERSIRDKIYRDVRLAAELGTPVTPEEATSKIRDLNRYTITWPNDEQWAVNHVRTLMALHDQGWNIYDAKYKTVWGPGDYYDGTNIQLHRGSDFVELQFHTPESHAIKFKSDALYAKARVLHPKSKLRSQLMSQIHTLWNKTRDHVPPGAQALGLTATFMMKIEPYMVTYHDSEGNPVTRVRVEDHKVYAGDTLLSVTPAEVAGLGGSADYKVESPADQVAKHYGPGPHPGTGSDQTIHGSGRVHVGVGSGKRKGKTVSKYLVSEDGTELPLSFEALSDAHVSIDGEVFSSNNTATIQARVLDRIKQLGLDPKAVDKNLGLIFESAMARYAAHPELIEADKFYEMWHEVLSDISEETGVEFSRAITSASIISPGLNAWSNIHYASDLATWVTANDGKGILLEGADAKVALEALDIAQDGILNPVWQDGQAGTTPENLGKPKPPPEPESFRWNQGQTVLADLNKLKGKDSFYLQEVDSYSAAYVLSAYRARNGGTTPEIPLSLSVDHATGNPLPFPKGGFSVKNTQFFGDAIAVLRGEVTSSQALGDVKTRSFHNNILDPTDALGFGDITVDYHMANAAWLATGFEDNNAISSPAIEGVGIGVRPVVADGIRKFVGRKLGKETLTSGRVQEILWAEWSRGQREHRTVLDRSAVTWYDPKKSSRTITHWEAFDGTLYPLYSLKEGKR